MPPEGQWRLAAALRPKRSSALGGQLAWSWERIMRSHRIVVLYRARWPTPAHCLSSAAPRQYGIAGGEQCFCVAQRSASGNSTGNVTCMDVAGRDPVLSSASCLG